MKLWCMCKRSPGSLTCMSRQKAEGAEAARTFHPLFRPWRQNPKVRSSLDTWCLGCYMCARESNPGLLRSKQGLYHWTTTAACTLKSLSLIWKAALVMLFRCKTKSPLCISTWVYFPPPTLFFKQRNKKVRCCRSDLNRQKTRNS